MAPWGEGSGLTKEEYALKVQQLEEQDHKLLNEREPSKTMIAPTPEVRKSVPPPTRLIFHDFDYVNPNTNLPEGDTIENVQLRN